VARGVAQVIFRLRQLLAVLGTEDFLLGRVLDMVMGLARDVLLPADEAGEFVQALVSGAALAGEMRPPSVVLPTGTSAMMTRSMLPAGSWNC
jgi:hypothetical protein